MINGGKLQTKSKDHSNTFHSRLLRQNSFTITVIKVVLNFVFVFRVCVCVCFVERVNRGLLQDSCLFFQYIRYTMSGDRGSLCGLVWFGKTLFKSFAFAFLQVVLCVLVYNILLIVLHYNLQFLYLFCLDENVYKHIRDCIATLYNDLRLTC